MHVDKRNCNPLKQRYAIIISAIVIVTQQTYLSSSGSRKFKKNLYRIYPEFIYTYSEDCQPEVMTFKENPVMFVLSIPANNYLIISSTSVDVDLIIYFSGHNRCTFLHAIRTWLKRDDNDDVIKGYSWLRQVEIIERYVWQYVSTKHPRSWTKRVVADSLQPDIFKPHFLELGWFNLDKIDIFEMWLSQGWIWYYSCWAKTFISESRKFFFFIFSVKKLTLFLDIYVKFTSCRQESIPSEKT